MWVGFVVGSLPYSEGFLPGSPFFLPDPQKPTFVNSSSNWKQLMMNHNVDRPLQIPVCFIILFLFPGLLQDLTHGSSQ